MDFKELVGKKVLIRRYGCEKILEVRVVRVSPSGRYAEVEAGITSWWIDTRDYQVLEVIE